MNRLPLPPGVTYEGEYPVYTVRQHGQIKGTVVTTARRRGTWTAYPLPKLWMEGPAEGHTGATLREAVEKLIAALEKQ